METIRVGSYNILTKPPFYAEIRSTDSLMFAAMHILLSLSILLLGAGSAWGDSSFRSKIGIDLRGIKPNLQNEIGWLAGVRTSRFIGTSNAHIGVGGYFGSPQGGDPQVTNSWHTGITLGYDGKMGKNMTWEIGFLGGLGAGKAANLEQTSYYVVEPSGGAGFQLGGGFRMTASVSYVHMTSAAVFSGSSFGFRIEYKTQTVSKELND